MTSDLLEKLCKERDDAMDLVRSWYNAERLAGRLPNEPRDCPHWDKYLAAFARLDAELIRQKPRTTA